MGRYRGAVRQIPLLLTRGRPGPSTVQGTDTGWKDRQEKPLGRKLETVPQTATGRQGENPQARERTLAKEFGKLTP